MSIKIRPNHGHEWSETIRKDGTVKPRAIWIASDNISDINIAIELEDIDVLIAGLEIARDEVLKAQSKVQAELAKPKLPTEPGLYKLNSVYYALKPSGQWTVLWENNALGIAPDFRTEADMLVGIGSGKVENLKRVGA